MTAEQINLVRELRGAACRCGGVKKSGETFCKSCYFKLPNALRRNLYHRISDGYEAAYSDAARFLDQNREALRQE